MRVRTASLGFPDLLMTRGGYQFKPDLPFIMGGEMAGDIVALGEGVTQFSPGDAVICAGIGAGGKGGRLTGSFAHYAVCSATHLRAKPASLDYATAAATGSAYLTAYVALMRRAALQAGEWLLVHGAAGGVGLAAVDLGKHIGARIIATASTDEKCARIEQLYRPDFVLNSRDGFREKVKDITNGGADVIYDPVGGDIFDESVRCIGWGGRLLVIGFAGGRIPTIGVNMPLIKGFSVVGVRAGEYGRRDPQKGQENLDAIWSLAEMGNIHPAIYKTYTLDDWRTAFADMEQRRIIGRAIFDPHLTNQNK